MKKLHLCYAAALCLTLSPALAAAPPKAKVAAKSKSASQAMPAMDEKAMMEQMMKLGSPGPHHEQFKKMEGEWNKTVKWTMDPSQPAQETHSTAVVTLLMDGRYMQEQSTGEMMGRPFTGMGITGYDNIIKKYVSTWIDNMGTGIMMSEGVPDASGNVVNWTGQSSDPMTGKVSKYRIVSRMIDDNKHTWTMYMKGPDGKEFQTMEITYERKM